MSTILVSGGAGFIGSNFVRLLAKYRPKFSIVVYDALTYAGNRENLKGVKHVFVKGDIVDRKNLEKTVKKYKPEYIVNFAAETHVDRSIHGGSEIFLKTNVFGVHTILETMRAHPEIKKFVQVSTDEVYGDTPVDSTVIFDESAPLRPSSPYSASKAAGDLLCMSHFRTYKTPVVVTRGSNTYGPYHFPEKIIPYFALRASQDRSLPVYGNGKNVRDWMHAEDHASGILAVLEKGKTGEIYNIAADQYYDNLTVTRMIAKAFGKGDEAIEFVADRPGHDLRYAPDASKIRRELGWSPKINFEEGLKQTIAWFKNNTAWTKRIVTKNKKINTHI